MDGRTKQLARMSGCLETVNVNSNFRPHRLVPVFPYNVVLDFETTCWASIAYPQCPKHEIIEFSCVLLDSQKDAIVSEFRKYVKPTESPKLTAFCTSLTGITQEMVDAGVTLKVCLDLYMKWHDEICAQYNLCFVNEMSPTKNKCAYVSWSDADLGMFLSDECYRKRIFKPQVFNQWIDLRAIYCEYYRRRPRGLKGALYEVGLKFEGQEHSGLDDARNTARLLGYMVKENVPIRVTTDLTKRHCY